MLFTMAVSLYTSRLVLRALGVDDFGIYNVVGGLVSMSSLISGTMHVTISRFLTYELGRGDDNKLRKVFSTSINIQLFLSIVIIIIAETLGIWFLNCEMLIPDGRLSAANWVFQCSLITFVIGLISSPYNAVIIAHEKMSWYAYLSIVEVILKLIVVFCLLLTSWDKLYLYSLLLVCVALIMRFLYVIYCRRHFPESKYELDFDKKLLYEMGSFAGWNNLGAMAVILRTQGINVLMNLFFGVAVNAARAIASQVEAAVNQFVSSFSVALTPQITKSIAKKDVQFSNNLIYKGAKYTYFLILLAVIPILFETSEVLRIWLGEYPDYTVIFLRLTLLVALTDKLSNTLTASLLASGKIKGLHIMVACVVIPVIPVSYWFYYLGKPPYISYILCIFALFFKFVFELILARDVVGIKISDYLNSAVIKMVNVTIISLLVPFILVFTMDESIFRFIVLSVSSLLWTPVAIYCIGLTVSERRFILEKIVSYKKILCRTK